MLVRAALVPDTVLLVPGTAGRARPLEEVAAAAAAAVADLVAAAPDVVVVVATAPRRTADDDRWGPLRPTFAAAGIPDTTWAPDGVPSVGTGPGGTGVSTSGPDVPLVRDTAAATGLVLLARAGWSGPVRVLELRPDGDAAARRALGSALVEGARVALLVLGSLSARRGPDAPLPELPEAVASDDAVLACLASWDAAARRRLADVPAAEAERLAVSAWTGWQVLVGATEAAAGAPLAAHVLAAGAPLGATYAVVRWV